MQPGVLCSRHNRWKTVPCNWQHSLVSFMWTCKSPGPKNIQIIEMCHTVCSPPILATPSGSAFASCCLWLSSWEHTQRQQEGRQQILQLSYLCYLQKPKNLQNSSSSLFPKCKKTCLLINISAGSLFVLLLAPSLVEEYHVLKSLNGKLGQV